MNKIAKSNYTHQDKKRGGKITSSKNGEETSSYLKDTLLKDPSVGVKDKKGGLGVAQHAQQLGQHGQVL